MRRLHLILLAALAAATLAGCKRERPGQGLEFLQQAQPIEGDTTWTKEVRDTKPFKAIYIFDVNDVNILTGQKWRVEIEGPACYVEAQKTEVEDTTLVVKYANHDTRYRRTRINICVPLLSDIEITGCRLATISGPPMVTPNIYVELNKVEMAVFSAVMQAGDLTIKTSEVTDGVFFVRARNLQLYAQHLRSARIKGTADSVAVHSAEGNAVDLTELHMGGNIKKAMGI